MQLNFAPTHHARSWYYVPPPTLNPRYALAMRPLVLLLACAFAAPAAPGTSVTFNRDVAPILYEHCAVCHRAGEIAPMSLLTYQEVRPWAAAIREAVATRQMPPWHADPRYGHFANDSRLTEAQIATIRTWSQTGAREGDPQDLPARPKFPEGWRIGKPDVVFDIGEDHVVEATGPDEYTYFVVPTNFTEDRWVKAVELAPGNRKVVHHAHVILETDQPKTPKPKDPATSFMFKSTEDHLSHMKPDAPIKNDGCATTESGNFWGRQEGQNGILASYLPGRGPDAYPEGTAKLVPKGARLRFQVHYSRVAGKPQTDRTRVGLIFADAPPAQVLRRMDISNYLFEIPPGADRAEVRECHTTTKDMQLLSLTAHMHYRGRDMRFEVERPGEPRETLLFVPEYSFAWQTVYRLAAPVSIPKGSRLIITAHFNNSSSNKWNPDDTRVIRWGEPSTEEMMDGWLEYVDAPL